MSVGSAFSTAAPDTSDLSIDVATTADSGAEYCADVTVSTGSPDPVTWEVDVDLSTFPVNGVPSSVWNTTSSFDTATETLTASGAGWNDTVVAGAPATWGFCADRPFPSIGDSDVEVQIVDDWGTGFCAEATVTTGSEVPISWSVELALSTFPINADGPPTEVRDADWSFDPTTMELAATTGPDAWWQTISAGESAVFGFCADRPSGGVPATPLVLPPFQGAGSVVGDGGQGATYIFDIELDEDLYLAGQAVAGLFVQRSFSGNTRAEVTLLADGLLASGTTGNFQIGDGWQPVSVPLEPDVFVSLTAGTTVTVEVQLVRLEMELDGPSEIMMAGG